MGLARRIAAAIGVFLGLAGAARAQGDITVPDGMTAGDQIDITYSNSDRAGQTVTVKLDNGDPFDPEVLTLEVTVSANGVGTVTWTIPSWKLVNLNAPDASEVTRAIGGSDGKLAQ